MRRAILLVFMIGCSKPAVRDARWARNADLLAGRWTVRLDSSINGSLELSVNRLIDREYPEIGLPTNYGTYDIAFPGLGGSPAGSRIPAVVAGIVGPDSVFVSFETDRVGFAMQMRGRLTGDSIRGSWVAGQSRGTIGSGAFTMFRR